MDSYLVVHGDWVGKVTSILGVTGPEFYAANRYIFAPQGWLLEDMVYKTLDLRIAAGDNIPPTSWTVQRGDWAQAVANYFDISIYQFREANPDAFTPEGWLIKGDVVYKTLADRIAAGDTDVYTVVSGDTAETVAAYFGITVLELRDANPDGDISPQGALIIGDTLYETFVIRKAFGANLATPTTWTVVAGDTPELIADYFEGSYGDVEHFKSNNLGAISLNGELTVGDVVYRNLSARVDANDVDLWKVEYDGHTADSIADYFGITVAELHVANPGASTPQGMITIGDTLYRTLDLRTAFNDTTSYPTSWVAISGDTGELVAAYFGITVNDLETANPSAITSIVVGDVLYRTIEDRITAGDRDVYIVQSGDTDDSMLVLFGITEYQLRAANPDGAITPQGELTVGDTLYKTLAGRILAGDSTNIPTSWVAISGDVQLGIAKYFRITIAELDVANPTVADPIVVGDTLYRTVSDRITADDYDTHIVISGDTVTSVSTLFDITNLRAANPDGISPQGFLYIGDILYKSTIFRRNAQDMPYLLPSSYVVVSGDTEQLLVDWWFLSSIGYFRSINPYSNTPQGELIIGETIYQSSEERAAAGDNVNQIPINWVTVSGDTTELVAAYFGITVDELRSANPIIGDASLLTIGITLYKYVNHLVVSGDTASSVSISFGITVDELRAANPDGISPQGELTVGDTLYKTLGDRAGAGDSTNIPTSWVAISGDTSELISFYFNITVDDLKIANPSGVIVGDTLYKTLYARINNNDWNIFWYYLKEFDGIQSWIGDLYTSILDTKINKKLTGPEITIGISDVFNGSYRDSVAGTYFANLSHGEAMSHVIGGDYTSTDPSLYISSPNGIYTDAFGNTCHGMLSTTNIIKGRYMSIADTTWYNISPIPNIVNHSSGYAPASTAKSISILNNWASRLGASDNLLYVISAGNDYYEENTVTENYLIQGMIDNGLASNMLVATSNIYADNPANADQELRFITAPYSLGGTGGTSGGAAIMTGCVALVMDYFNITSTDAAQRLLDTANKTIANYDSSVHGVGAVDLDAALSTIISHLVVSGDTASSVSISFGITVDELRSANPDGALTPQSSIGAGDTLYKTLGDRIVDGGSITPPTFWVVVSGDGLSIIAKYFGITLSELYAANPGFEGNSLSTGAILYRTITDRDNSVSHVVVSGDTDDTVSTSFGITANELRDANPDGALTPQGVLTVGDTLYKTLAGRILAGGSITPPTFWVVVSGDGLSIIAKYFGITLSELYAANPGFEGNSLSTGAILYRTS